MTSPTDNRETLALTIFESNYFSAEKEKLLSQHGSEEEAFEYMLANFDHDPLKSTITRLLQPAVAHPAKNIFDAPYFVEEKKKLVAQYGSEAKALEYMSTNFDKPLMKARISRAMAASGTSVAAPVQQQQQAPPPPPQAKPEKIYINVNNDMQVDNVVVVAPTENGATTTETTAAASSKSKSSKKTAAPKKTKSAAVLELEAAPVTKDGKGLIAAELKKQCSKVDIVTLTEYVRDPLRATIVLAAIVAQDVNGDKKSEKKLGELCKAAFDGGRLCDGKPKTKLQFDLSSDELRAKHIEAEDATVTKELLESEYGAKFEGATDNATKLVLQREVCARLRKDLCRSVSFNDIAPYITANTGRAQFYILAYGVTSQDCIVNTLKSKTANKLFPLDQKRAFVQGKFAAEVDADGVALIDIAALGSMIKADVKELPVAELLEVYKRGDSAGVYAWFKKTFPLACDPTQPTHLQETDFQLHANDLTLSVWNEDPRKRAKTAPANGAAAASTGGGSKKKSTKKSEPSAADADGEDGPGTIKRFASTMKASTKAREPQQLATAITFGTIEEESHVAKSLRSVVEQTGIDAIIEQDCPLTTKEQIRSIVMPHTEAKAGSTQPKKPKTAAAEANAAAAAADDEEEGGGVAESHRSQYHSYSAHIPKVTKFRLMGTGVNGDSIAGGDNNKKGDADFKVLDYYSRAVDAGHSIAEGAVLDGASYAELVAQLNAKRPEAIVNLLMANTRLEQAMSHIALAAMKRNEFEFSQDEPRKFFEQDNVQEFLANALFLDESLNMLHVHYGKDDWEKVAAITPHIEAKTNDVLAGWFGVEQQQQQQK